jgi:DNA mismatch repair protein MSH6
VDAAGKIWTVSPGQAQWWRFKAAHFDSVIMFKMVVTLKYPKY